MASSAFAGGPKFVNFSTWDEAKVYYETRIAPYVAAMADEIGYQVVRPQYDPGYKRLEKIVAKISRGYFRYFPELRSLVHHPPFVMLVAVEDRNASAISDPVTGEKPNFFVVNKGSLGASDDDLAGMVAHELAHFYLQYSDNNEAYPKTKYYFRADQKLEFGPFIVNDEYAEAAFKKEATLLRLSGTLINSELDGLPLGSMDQPNFTQLLKYLLNEHLGESKCRDIVDDIKFFGKNLAGKINEDLTLKVTSSSKLLKQTQTLERSLVDCLGGYRYSFSELLRGAFPIPEEIRMAKKKIHDPESEAQAKELEQLFANNDAIQAIFMSARTARQKINRLNNFLNISHLASYNHEDHADEVATYILLQLHLNPDSLNLYLQKYSGAKLKCEKNSTAYGPFDNYHHTECWRIYRNTKFKEYLLRLTPEQRDHFYSH